MFVKSRPLVGIMLNCSRVSNAEFSALAVCTCATLASTFTISPTAPMASFSSPTSSRELGVRILPVF
jgi:hypothetical protein